MYNESDREFIMRSITMLFAILLFVIPMGCQSTETRNDGSTDSQVAQAIEADQLIQSVANGTDYVGKQIRISGVALNNTESGLVNIGSADTYRSGVYTNYISVYEVDRLVTKGSRIRFRVLIEDQRAVKLQNGSTMVLIDSKMID